MSVICPNCHFDNFEGSLFCVECGTKLVTEDGLSTAAIHSTDSAFRKDASESVETPDPVSVSEAFVSLHVVKTGQIVPLVGRTEFTIGRISEGQSILPDIDLTPFGAYSQGVSRLHSTLKIKGNEIYIIDLGSSNGTRINKEKLQPHKENLLTHGDMVNLGRFKVQVLIRQES